MKFSDTELEVLVEEEIRELKTSLKEMYGRVFVRGQLIGLNKNNRIHYMHVKKYHFNLEVCVHEKEVLPVQPDKAC